MLLLSKKVTLAEDSAKELYYRYVLEDEVGVEDLRDWEGGFDVVSTSEIEESGDELKSVKGVNLVVVCDSEFSSNYPISFSCNEEEVTSTDGYISDRLLKKEYASGRVIFVIPETLLSYEEVESTRGLLHAIDRSDKSAGKFYEDGIFKIENERQKVPIKKIVLEQVKDLVTTTTFEFFRISLFMVIASVTLYPILKGLYSNGEDLNYLT